MKKIIISLILMYSFNIFSQQNIKVGERAPLINITDWVVNVPKDKKLENKFVVLEFWATWCGPCLRAVPHLNDLQDKFKRDDLYFISITDEPVHKIEKIHSVVDFKTIVVSDQTKATQKEFGDGKRGITQIPLTVLIDNKGIIKWKGNPSRLTESLLNDFLNEKPISDTDTVRKDNVLRTPKVKKHLEIEKLKGFEKKIYLAGTDDIKLYIDIKKSKSNISFSDKKTGPNLFYSVSVNVSDILTDVFEYNINEIFVHEDLDKDRYDIWFKNDSLPKEKALKFLQDTLFSKLKIEKKKGSKKIIAKELMIENKNLLEKSTDKESDITGVQGKKTIYSRITLKDLASELNKTFPHYLVFLSKDKEVYNFFIDNNSYEKAISDLKQYGISVRDKEVEVKLFEFYQKN